MAYIFEPRKVETQDGVKWQMYFKDTDNPTRTLPVGEPHPTVTAARKDKLAKEWSKRIIGRGELAVVELEQAIAKAG